MLKVFFKNRVKESDVSSFQYTVIDKRGKEKKGTMDAVSMEKVHALLKADGLIPIKVQEQSFLTKDLSFNIGNPVKARELGIFCRQFHSILHAGISLIYALDMLSSQTENKVLKKAIKEIQLAVEKGETLTGAMKAQGDIFPPILLNMVEAGEASGNLDHTFETMATHFDKENRLKATVKKAMVYPIFVAIIGVAVLILMLAVVIPQFTTMFDDMGIDMPLMTKIVISLSDMVIANWYIIVIVVIALVIIISVLKNTEKGKLIISKVGLRIPIVNKIIIKTASARLGRTLSTLLAAGIAIIDAMDIIARITDNVIVKDVLLETRDEVARGGSISGPLEASQVFPAMVYQMIRIGEETGQLEDMLGKVADYYEEDVETTTQSFLAILEPMMIIIVAGFVGIILMAVFTPMLSIYGGLENM